MFVCYCQYQTSKQHINRQADVCRRGTDICSPHTHVCHQNTLGIIPYYFLTPPNSSTCLWQELVANKLLLKTISFLDHLNKKREALKAKSHTLRNGNFWSCLGKDFQSCLREWLNAALLSSPRGTFQENFPSHVWESHLHTTRITLGHSCYLRARAEIREVPPTAATPVQLSVCSWVAAIKPHFFHISFLFESCSPRVTFKLNWGGFLISILFKSVSYALLIAFEMLAWHFKKPTHLLVSADPVLEPCGISCLLKCSKLVWKKMERRPRQNHLPTLRKLLISAPVP